MQVMMHHMVPGALFSALIKLLFHILVKKQFLELFDFFQLFIPISRSIR